MSTNDVIEAYVVDVMRRLPSKERNEIGFELRDLLTEMLAEKTRTEGKAADDAMVLAMLRNFGTPAEVAARYRPPGVVIIPADQTRTFALLSLAGIGLQWALTLPRVFAGQSLTTWWFTWGLGAFWWPGFLVTMTLLSVWVRQLGLFKPSWKPRSVDPERINRGAMIFGLVWFAIGAATMICLPWIAKLMPDPMPRIFAFHPEFLRERAWPVLFSWLGSFASLFAVLVQGRWSKLTRRLEIAFNAGFIALLAWWLVAGDIFLAKPTDDGAKAAIGLVIVIIIADLAYKLYRGRVRIHTPKLLAESPQKAKASGA